ncbi:FAD-binding oxidoreductase [Acetobacteraceae bacterium KSS8]|uniref:FAD-binding oxidoreductase n=1 Tax=Endosaccharibacter trunci TaxID=2812733 RepID=A0ABT1W6L6_9PROT|nr:FAD-binding oxidoreductase [Acetobacteraceae bacterium KSS8]
MERDGPSLPARVDVVVIGGGIVGACTALELAKRGRSVALIEKGDIGAEQSGRNWGWCRTMGRDPAEVPLSLLATQRWRELQAEIGTDLGYRQAGTLYLAATPQAQRAHVLWLDSVRGQPVDTRLLDGDEVAALLPGLSGRWAGGLHTPSDGRAEPGLAAGAIAAAAGRAGVRVLSGCAARGLEVSSGRLSAVVTERGAIACGSVVVAGGAFSRLFCRTFGLSLPQLRVNSAAARTEPVHEGPLADGPEIAVGGPDFAFRRRLDGGYTFARRGLATHEIVPDSFALLRRFLPTLRSSKDTIRLRLGRGFATAWQDGRRPRRTGVSVFERQRLLDPGPNPGEIDSAWSNLIRAYPDFSGTRIAESWSGVIDVTPDALPIISTIAELEGVVIATGFSGHGFGVAPGTAMLVADLVTGATPVVDPSPFALARFGATLRSPSRADN